MTEAEKQGLAICEMIAATSGQRPTFFRTVEKCVAKQPPGKKVMRR